MLQTAHLNMTKDLSLQSGVISRAQNTLQVSLDQLETTTIATEALAEAALRKLGSEMDQYFDRQSQAMQVSQRIVSAACAAACTGLLTRMLAARYRCPGLPARFAHRC